jgi:glycosyltransferase involved in cell wall biosynthesis
MKKVELAVVMPVYNEAGIISEVINKWIKKLKGLDIEFEIHAYNDGSKDQTLKILNQLALENKRLIVHDKLNSGHGPTILQAYRENSDAEWIFQTDSDDEIDSDQFEDLWRNKEDYDFLIGRRVYSGQLLARKLVSIASRAIVRIFYGSKVYDVNSPFRLMRSKAFKNFFLSLPEKMFAPNVVISGIVSLYHLRAYEIPVQKKKRTTGEVSLKKLKLIKAALKSSLQTITYRFKLITRGTKSTSFNM